MVNPFFQLTIADASFKIYPVPVLFVKVPGRRHLVVLFAQSNGQFRITFQADSPAILRQVDQGEHLPGYIEDQGGLIKGKAFGDGGFGQAVIADFFVVHRYNNKTVRYYNQMI